MKSSRTKYLLTALIFAAIITYLVMSNAVPHRFHQFQSRFLDWYFATNPVTATWIGIHTYDNHLPDKSEQALHRQLTRLGNFQQELREINPSKLNIHDRIDYQILEHALSEQVFYLKELKIHTWDPLDVMWSLGYAYESLMGYDFAPHKERAKNLLERLSSTPVFLKNAQSNLEAMPLPHIETASRQCQGLIGMLKSDLSVFISHLGDETSEAILEAADVARLALKDFITFLEEKKETGPHRDFRLGSDLYNKKLSFTLNEGLTAAEVLARAESQLKSVQGEMLDLAFHLYEDWFGEAPDLNSHQEQLATVKRVLNRIAEDHVNRAEVVENARVTIEELVRFIEKNDLLTLDPSNPLEIRETPEYQRGVSIASLQAPGPLENNLDTYYNVSPIPEDWDDQKAESFLREYNRLSVKILSIHEALPGHYVQLYYANRHTSLIRAVFGSGVMVEGWAHYTEGMMIDAGFGGGDPRYRLVQLKWKLRGIANAILDQSIHAGSMTEKEAVDLMVNETFQEEAEASAKWRRAQLTSAQLSTYFVGSTLMWDLRRDYEEQEKTGFDLKTFHEELLSYGSIPVRYLRQLMLN